MGVKPEEELEFLDESDVANDGFQPVGVGGSGGSGSLFGLEPRTTVVGNWVLNQSKHPLTALFHILFKVAALFIYMFGSWFTTNFIFTFVLCIILLAFDFWTVKNVSGRLLVGLRWWSYVREDGSNEWFFESLEDMAEISPFDARIFWGALYATPVAWSLMLVIGVLRLQFEYLPVVCAALLMSGANIVNYLKCSTSAQNKMKGLMESGLKVGANSALENSSFRSWVFTTLLSVTSNNSSGAAPRSNPNDQL